MTETPTAISAPGFGVYIHWPFCAQKCPYCDFNSHVRHHGWDEPRFRSAYLAELDWTAATREPGDHEARPGVTSIFFGGGTPSLMRPDTVAAIIDRIDRNWGIAPGAEITLEANPGSVDAARFRGYRDAGVNRVSLGLQSLDDGELRRLGRIHTVAEAKAAVAIAAATFPRYSFDLIYSRPHQTPQAWRGELREALAMAGGHLSLYQLTIEPETPYAALHAAGRLTVPDADTALALFDITFELTSAAGLPAYEISNHASPGEESRHNLLYWRYGEYAGIGAGAHGRLALDKGRRATATERNPERWLALVEKHGHGLVEATSLTPGEIADEALLMGLRLTEGIDLGGLAAMTRLTPSDTAVNEMCRLGLVQRVGGSRIRASGPGRFILNELVVRLAHSLVPTTAP